METRNLNTLRFVSRWGSYCRAWTPALAVFLLVATSPLAASAICGNFVVDGSDQCDQSAAIDPLPLNNGDGCTTSCTIEECGNGLIDSSSNETCDPGTGGSGCGSPWTGPGCDFAVGSTPTCDYNCSAPACGDGIWNVFTEICDPTAAGWSHATCDAVSDTGTPGGCTLAAWADGTLNTANAETCDDGNVTLGDGCDIHVLSGCGNGYLNPIAGTNVPITNPVANVTWKAELCDGNLGCDINCTPIGCGNGNVTVGEACDPITNPSAPPYGNTDNGGPPLNDGCDAGCQNVTCGNGLLQVGEQCDDGVTDPAPLNNGDGCDTNCKTEVCGNGIFQPVINVSPFVEQCDNAGVDGDGCDSNCRLEKCGNGFVQIGEFCDPNTGTTANPLLATASTAGCDKDCTGVFCQDNLFNPNTEQCDDGNGLCGDGCRANCTTETCGDGLIDCGEMCDPAAFGWTPLTCDANCDTALCGNGVTQAALGETCDDGDTIDLTNGCDSNCKITGCGNGVTAGTEICDPPPGNLVDGDGCDSNCKPTGCVNGIKTAGEECDDGNLVISDGCNNACKDEYCGNGFAGTGPPAQPCDDGNTILTDACPTAGSPPLGLGCQADPDGDGTFAGDPYLLGPYDLKNDGCQAVTYSTATPPNQKVSKPKISIGKLSSPGAQTVSMSGYFNPARSKVCEDGLTTCTTNANCSGVPGTDACGIPRPNLQGVHIEVRNLLSATSSNWKPVLKIDVPGEIGTPGGEYQQRSATPACGNPRDGWRVQVSGSRTTYSYNNTSGLIPSLPGVDGTCTVSAQGLKTIRLVYDLTKNQWQYSVTFRNTTLTNPPTVGVDGKVSGTLQSQLALGTQVLDSGASNDPGDVGNCADAQFNGASPGGMGSVATCKGTAVSISCR